MMETNKGIGAGNGIILLLSFVLLLCLGSTVYGAGWTKVIPPESGNYWYLTGVHFSSSGEGWAVGEDYGGANTKGALLHYAKGFWKKIAPPSISGSWRLSGVYFPTADEGWAVGSRQTSTDPTYEGIILHYSDGVWQRQTVTPPSGSTDWWLTAVHFTSADEGWAVGYDHLSANSTAVLLHYTTASGWEPVGMATGTYWQLHGVQFTSADEGWAVGLNGSSAKGVLLRYTTTGGWESVVPPTVTGGSSWTLNGVHFTSADEGWAVGYDTAGANSKGVLLHYTSTGGWESVTPPDLGIAWLLNAVHFTSADEGWAVGYDNTYYNTSAKGVLLHYSGGNWTNVSPPAVSSKWTLNALHFVSPDSGWAVGSGYTGFKGVLLRYDSGTRTLAVSSSGAGTGSVVSVPDGIDCGSTCSAKFTKGSKVSLVPVPDKGSRFSHWSGGCTGTNGCKVKMTEDRSVEAVFASGDCTYTASPDSRTVNYKGGTAKFTIAGTGSSFCAVPDIEIEKGKDWISLSGFSFSGAKGTALLTVTASESSIPRSASISSGDESVTVSQKGCPCNFGISPTVSGNLSLLGDTGSFTVTAAPSDCAWTVAPAKKSDWITITSPLSSGTGTGTVRYEVAPATAARTGSIVVNLNKKSKVFTVRQKN